MAHHAQHHQHHEQQRAEHKKEEAAHERAAEKGFAVHPAWLLTAGIVLTALAVLVWIIF